MNVGVILDEMPEDCNKCQFMHEINQEENKFLFCYGIDFSAPNYENAGLLKMCDHDYDIPIVDGGIPDWCPLQEVEPTRYAEWLYVDEYDDLRRCSECCYEVKEENISQYCPHCGARMEDEDEL